METYMQKDEKLNSKFKNFMKTTKNLKLFFR